MLAKTFVGILTALVTGLCGWGLGVSRTLAQQEAMMNGLGDHINVVEEYGRVEREDIKKRLDRIQTDLTEIRRDLWNIRRGNNE